MGSNTDYALITIGPITVLVIIIICCICCCRKCCQRRRNRGTVLQTEVRQPLAPTPIIVQHVPPPMQQPPLPQIPPPTQSAVNINFYGNQPTAQPHQQFMPPPLPQVPFPVPLQQYAPPPQGPFPPQGYFPPPQGNLPPPPQCPLPPPPYAENEAPQQPDFNPYYKPTAPSS